VAISPYYYYPPDHTWRFGGPGETLMHKLGMFDRKSPLSLDGFENSGAARMPEYRAYIEDGETIVCSPHKVFGPQTNDLVLQLRKQRRDQIVLAGMSAHLCVESDNLQSCNERFRGF
jgi:biuret amidohydrolase